MADPVAINLGTVVGPPGKDGTGFFPQEDQPVGRAVGDVWYKPTTGELRVLQSDGSWELIATIPQGGVVADEVTEDGRNPVASRGIYSFNGRPGSFTGTSGVHVTADIHSYGKVATASFSVAPGSTWAWRPGSTAMFNLPEAWRPVSEVSFCGLVTDKNTGWCSVIIALKPSGVVECQRVLRLGKESVESAQITKVYDLGATYVLK